MNRIIRWGILGTGNIAHKFAEGLKHVGNTKILAVGSRDYTKAQNFANDFGIERSYGSYEDLVKDPEVDVIYISTPNHLHFKNTMLCLDHGKHVLCEKPFAVNGKEVREMIRKAESNNLFLMEALWSRFLPHIEKARELVTSGLIGEVKFLKSDFGIHFKYDSNHRVFNRDLIGGSLLDIGIYPVFLSLYILGVPKKISALAGLGPTQVDHNCSMAFQYEKDLVSVLYSSTVAQTEVTSEIHGTLGKIVFDPWWYKPAKFRLISRDGQVTPYEFNFIGNGYNYEAEEVIGCILQGKIQSDRMSWQHSLQLIDTMDEIRKQCNIVYPGYD